MTIFALHGIGAIFFWIIIACVFLYYKSEMVQDFFIGKEEFTGYIMCVCVVFCLIFWLPSFLMYGGNKNENCGYASEEACFEVIEKYNDKYNLSMTTADEFKNFQKEQRMMKVQSGIKALKKIEQTYGEIDIQSDIDELEALYKLNEIDYLKEKYK